MIINEIEIKKFGKIKNSKLKFTKNINIIYGENEKGKTTIQEFIKASLYGFSNRRVKDLSLNNRLKYVGESGAEGKINITFDGQNYIVNRKFGKTKKSDDVKVYDGITGEEKKDLNSFELGKNILGINYNTFKNTLCISQLGVSVNKEKDDEIMEKISNIFKSGDEDVFYESSINKLENLKKELQTSKKTGKLDRIKRDYENCINQKNNALKLVDKNIINELNLSKLKELRKFLKDNIDKLYLHKKNFRKKNIAKDMEKIINFKNEIQSVEENLRSLNNELLDSKIDYIFLADLKEDHALLGSLKDKALEKSEEVEEIKKNIKEREEYINSLGFDLNSYDNIEDEIVTLKVENKELKDKIDIIEKLDNDIKFINYNINKKNVELKNLNINLEDKNKIQNFLNLYESKLKIYEENNKKRSSQNNEYVGYRSEKKESKHSPLLIIGVALYTLVFLACSILMKNIAFKILCIALAFLGFFALFNLYKAKENKNVLQNKNDLNTDNLKIEILQMEETLKKYYKDLNIRSFYELKDVLKKYDSIKNELVIHEIRLKDRYNDKSKYDEVKTFKRFDENLKKLNSIFEETKTSSFDELKTKIKTFKLEKDYLNKLNQKYETFNKILKDLEDEQKLKEDNINKKLKHMGIVRPEFSKIDGDIERYYKKLKDKEKFGKRLEALNEGCRVLLKDRDVLNLEKEMENINIKELEGINFEGEEAIDSKISRNNEELLEVEKKIKDVENNMKNLFNGQKSLTAIEEEIKNLQNDIELYTRKYNSIEIATNVLKDSFKDMQNSFGPVLNKSVSKIFNKITNGYYKEVMVSEDYEMALKTKDDIFNFKYLSNGAIDQVYLSLRLAIIDMIFKDKFVPIICDDAFTQYDDKRLKEVLNYMIHIAKDKQILIFTCQKREVDILSKNPLVNIIRL